MPSSLLGSSIHPTKMHFIRLSPVFYNKSHAMYFWIFFFHHFYYRMLIIIHYSYIFFKNIILFIICNFIGLLYYALPRGMSFGRPCRPLTNIVRTNHQTIFTINYRAFGVNSLRRDTHNKYTVVLS